EALPFVAAGVAGYGQQSVPTAANRGEPGGDPADVAVHVGEDHVLRRALPRRERLRELAGALGPGQRPAAEIGRAPGFGANPTQGERTVPPDVFVDYRPVSREPQFQLDRLRLAAHHDLFADDRHSFPFVPDLVPRRVLGVGLLDIEVCLVGADNRETP